MSFVGGDGVRFNELIETYDFAESALQVRDDFVEYYSLEGSDEQKFIDFSREYWTYPRIELEELRERYNIPDNINFVHILMAYPSDVQNDMVRKFYKGEVEEDEFMTAIKLPLINITNSDGYCPYCYNNLFNITKSGSVFFYECHCCGVDVPEAYLLSKEQVREQKLFYNSLATRLKQTPCPMCENELVYDKIDGGLSYRIQCKKCSYQSYSLQDVSKDYIEKRSKEVFNTASKINQRDKKCMDFIANHFPELKDDGTIINTIKKWSEEFSSDDIIKAFAVTVDRICKGKLPSTEKVLLSYTRGILNYGSPVIISEDIYREFELDKWLG